MPLPDAMPVDSSAVVLHIVRQSHLDPVAPIRVNRGSHVLSVHQQNRSLYTVWRCCTIRDIEVVLPSASRIWPVGVEISVDVPAIVPTLP